MGTIRLDNTDSIMQAVTAPSSSNSTSVTMKCFSFRAGLTAVHLLFINFLGLIGLVDIVFIAFAVLLAHSFPFKGAGCSLVYTNSGNELPDCLNKLAWPLGKYGM